MEILVSSICTSFHLGAVASPEKELQEHLYKNYHKKIRPVLNKTRTVNVYFDLEVVQIIEVVSKFSKLPPECSLEGIYRVLEALRSICRMRGLL